MRVELRSEQGSQLQVPVSHHGDFPISVRVGPLRGSEQGSEVVWLPYQGHSISIVKTDWQGKGGKQGEQLGEAVAVTWAGWSQEGVEMGSRGCSLYLFLKSL